jgi:hypothetical protein
MKHPVELRKLEPSSLNEGEVESVIANLHALRHSARDDFRSTQHMLNTMAQWGGERTDRARHLEDRKRTMDYLRELNASLKFYKGLLDDRRKPKGK